MRYILLLAIAVISLAPAASANDRWRNSRNNGYYGYNNGYSGYYRNVPPGIARKGGWLPPGQVRRLNRGYYGWGNRDYRGYDRYDRRRDTYFDRYNRNRYYNRYGYRY